jgi:hypothetical protein
MSYFDWLIKKIQSLQDPQNKTYIVDGVLLVWPTFINEMGRTFGKTNGIKVWCYWEHLRK